MSATLRPNFGCGTLIVLAMIVFAASRLIPHGSESKLKDPVPKTQTALKPKPDPAPSKPNLEPEDPASHEAEAIIRDSIALLSTWMEQKKETPATQPVTPQSKSPALANSKPAAKPVLTETAAPTQGPKPGSEVSKEEGGHPITGWLDTLKTASEKVETVMQKPAESSANGATTAPLAGENVFNNPWDQSVDQVARYLKKHTHDAASLSILDWGKVTKNKQGYEVRCTFRSKNVLGREITQTRTFVLSPTGEIKDIRD
jgi:hypothetical protein